jgi:hypothetical protein
MARDNLETRMRRESLSDDHDLVRDFATGIEMAERLRHPVFSGVRLTVDEYRAMLARLAAAQELYTLFPHNTPRAAQSWLTLQRPPNAEKSNVLNYREGVMLVELPIHLYEMDILKEKDLKMDMLPLAKAVQRQMLGAGKNALLPNFYDALGKTLGKAVLPFCYRLVREETIYTAPWPVEGPARRQMLEVQGEDVSEESTR